MEELCEALLSERGEVSGTRIAAAILDRYERSTPREKADFFRLLVDKHDVDADAVAEAAAAYAAAPDAATLARLLAAAGPPRQELLRRLNRLPGATARRVKMREDLLSMLTESPAVRRADIDFRHLFMSWFNRGFLVLRSIDWTTPANILEKIIAHE